MIVFAHEDYEEVKKIARDYYDKLNMEYPANVMTIFYSLSMRDRPSMMFV